MRTTLRALAVADRRPRWPPASACSPRPILSGTYRFGVNDPGDAGWASPKPADVRGASRPRPCSPAPRPATDPDDHNGETAYIGSARWVSPGQRAVRRSHCQGFRRRSLARARLISRGEVAKSDFVLRLEVRSFEAQYVDGPKSAPDVLVSSARRAQSQQRPRLGRRPGVRGAREGFATTVSARSSRRMTARPARCSATSPRGSARPVSRSRNRLRAR
jgi:hypothetical protein